MIYVIVNEVGDYADYQKHILYGSSSKEVIDRKLQELLAMSARVTVAHSEMWKLLQDFRDASYPISPGTPEQWSKFIEDEKIFKEYTLSNVLNSHDLSRDAYDTHIAYGGFSIEEVKEPEVNNE